MNRIILFLVLITFIFAITACNSDKEVIVNEEEVSDNDLELATPIDPEPSEPEEEEEEEEELFNDIFPLNGIGTNESIDYRPIGIMLENSKSARPQSGIHQADLVYEVLSEGTITRLLAFFHSEKPEVIGPVRSAREYYINLNNGFNGVYVSAGGSPGAFAMFQSGQADHISGLSYDGRYFYRSSDRKAPHNLYTSYESILNAVDHAGYSMTEAVSPLPFIEEVDLNPDGVTANSIDINYGSKINSVRYEYDSETGSYHRFNGGEQTVDLETKTPVTLKNIFIVEATHRVIDDVGRREVDLHSGGKAFLIQKGVAKEVEWENKDGRILPVHHGENIGFLPGKTWVNFVQTRPGIKESVTIYE